jgi:flagellar hook-associated protein 1 FlgK
MSLDTGLGIANSGLAAISQQFSLISQNIANASTPGYAAESSALSNKSAGGIGSGVASAPATLTINHAVQSALVSSMGTASYQATIASAMSGLDQVMGTPGQGNDLSSLTANVQSSFTSLLNDPSNAAQQSAVISAAQGLTGQINNIADTIGTARQTAQDQISTSLTTLNTSLNQIGNLNTQIIALTQQGLSTADLKNQRTGLVQIVAQLTGAKSISAANGTLSLYTARGLQLPTTGASFQTSPSAIGATDSYPGTIPAITLNGQDVTAGLGGGSIGAAISLRDQILPTQQASLDSFAQTVASRFAAQGLNLFSDPTGAIPAASSMTGFANLITVNPAVVANPAFVRDGTNAVVASTSGATSFTPNSPSGPAGFSTLIDRIINFSFGNQVQAGVPQTPAPTTGLGPAGTINLPYPGNANIGTLATSVVANEAATSASAQSASTQAGQTQSALQTQATQTSGVSIDQQMGTLVSLQNAYAANAKVVGIAQQMMQTMEAMIS